MAVGPDGYVWWYLDGLSDDGRHGITVIAFIGSVFSPYYAAARREGLTDPEDHVCVNVCLYGPGSNRWAMTERKRRALSRDRTTFAVGPSGMQWDGAALSVWFSERGAPIPYGVRGRVRMVPSAITPEAFDLTPDGRHRWWPIGPCGRIEVDLRNPALSWRGAGYLDSNAGDGPLETAFHRWDWSRASVPGPGGQPGAAVLYDGHRRGADDGQGDPFSLALRFNGKGGVEQADPPPRVPLPATLWRIKRYTQVDPGNSNPGRGATVARTLEDTPFYARSEVHGHLFGQRVEMMHESLDLNRFRSRIVQGMLRFRMPRL